MTQVAVNEKDLPFWKRSVSLSFVIDILTALYIVSIYVFSYNQSLNVFSKALALALMGLLAVYMLKQKTIKFDGLLFAFGAFLFVCLVSCFWALDISIAISKVSTVAQLFVLTILLYNYIQREKKVDLLINFLMIAGTIFAVYVVLYFGVEEYFNGLEEGVRMGTEVTNVNTIGMTAGAASIIALWNVVYNKKQWSWIAVAICTIVAFGSGSRKALLFVLMGVVLLFVLKGNSKKKIISLLQLAASLMALYYILKLPIFGTVNVRMEQMLNFFDNSGRVDGSTKLRMEMIALGWEQFLKTPFTGVGIGNSAILTKQAFGSTSYLHNNYVELLASVGVVGTFFYYLMFILPIPSVFKSAIRQNKYAILASCLIIIQLVMQYGAVLYYNKVTYIYILLFFSIAKKEKANVEKDKKVN